MELENQTVSRKSDNEITVVKSVPVEFTFTPEYLKKQIKNIQEQKDRDNAQRDIELAECQAYLDKFAELEVVEKPIEIKEKPTETSEEIKPLE